MALNLGRVYVTSLGILPQGVPSTNVYKNLLKASFFREMESFSNVFLSANSKKLKGYSSHWVADPFHQWSRQWEYPFTYSHIQGFPPVQRKEEVRILDAGSGCTFFPYYLSHKLPNCHVFCCDKDSILATVFAGIDKKNERVEFKTQNLGELDYEDFFFDIIYCISVLEHSKEINETIKQFKRVLKPRGLMILTFDISLDNNTEIPSETAQDLLNMIDRTFVRVVGSSTQTISQSIHEPEILSTEFAKKLDEGLLPWRTTLGSMLSQLRKLRIPKKPFFNLTVFCGAWLNQ
jgi:ubiquinone/menaquinone biosynthesis C-methylase UbiE